MKLGLKGGSRTMINSVDAANIIKKEFPDLEIQKQISYNNSFVFILSFPDPDEPPCFVKVNESTGAFTDFVPWEEPDPVALEQALLA